VTLGPVIHNEYVVRELEGQGIRPVSDISEVKPHNTVIIRSHGAGKDEREALAALGVGIIDATCPDVRKIHDIVRGEYRAGRLPVIIGERSHPEVAAIASWCGDHEIFETAEELSNWLGCGENSQKPISLVFQTTNTGTVYKTCTKIVKKVCTNYKIFDTICGATHERQREADWLSKTADVMVVIGGSNSANSLRLADICRENCGRVLFVGNANELVDADISASDTVGITAGASTPAWIIKEVTQKMSEEVKLDRTCVEQESMEPAPPDVAGDSTQDKDPQVGDLGPGARNPELAVEADAKETVGEDSGPAAPGEAGLEGSAIEPGAPGAPEGSGLGSAADEAVDISPELILPGDEKPEGEDGDSDVSGAKAGQGVSLAAGDADEPAPPVELAVPAEPEGPAEPEEPDAQEESPDALEDGALDESVPVAETFEEMLEKSIKTLHTGEKVTGVVTSITSNEVSVDLGTKQSGYIPISEFTDDANTNIDDIIKVGDTIETFVMRVNDVEGMVMLSKKRLDAIKNWDVIEAAKENRAIVEGFVTEENKGGVVVNVKGVRVFVPASQTGLPKSSPMSELVRKPVKLRITEVNQSRRRVVGSIRAVQADERREKSERVWNDIEVGKQYSGVVKSMTSYGVFVDIGGVDGMIHISELSWTRIKQPSEVMAVGDEVSVYILSFDKEHRKISLGYKKSEDNPWTRFTTKHAVGNVVNAKIVKMMPFGAFAEICPGVDGLIHISQITDHRIGLPSEVLSDGQLVDVKITEIDYDRKKVSLSIRALIDPSSQPLTEKEAAQAVLDDKTPVIVYDTDAPPKADEGTAPDSRAQESKKAQWKKDAPEPEGKPNAAVDEPELEPELEPEAEPELGEDAASAIPDLDPEPDAGA